HRRPNPPSLSPQQQCRLSQITSSSFIASFLQYNLSQRHLRFIPLKVTLSFIINSLNLACPFLNSTIIYSSIDHLCARHTLISNTEAWQD
ncbi:hypothetical protein AKJ16_DCAP26668, partial [Drosera capensis]